MSRDPLRDKMCPGVRFKCCLGQENRNIYLDNPVSLTELQAKIAQYFQPNVTIMAVDKNGTRTGLRTQADVDRCLDRIDPSESHSAVRLVLATQADNELYGSDALPSTARADQQPQRRPSDPRSSDRPYHAGTYQRAQLRKEPSARRGPAHRRVPSDYTTSPADLPMAQLSMQDAASSTPLRRPMHTQQPGDRPSSPPPGYLETDRTQPRVLDGGRLREVSGGGEFIPEPDDDPPHALEQPALTIRSTGSGHSFRSIRSTHSVSSSQSVYSGNESHRSRHSLPSNHSTQSSSGLVRTSVKHVFPEDSESGVGSQARASLDPRSNEADRNRSGTYPRVTGTAQPASRPPYTLPRERAASTRSVFESPRPPVTPTTHVFFDRGPQPPQPQPQHQHQPQQPQQPPQSHTPHVVPKAPRRWRKGMLLGTGAFGKVYLALDEDTGAEIAVKIVDLFTGDEESRKAVEALEGEIQMLHSLKHPRIVTYLGTERTSETLCILMEYVPGRSIARRLSEYGAFSIDVARKYTRQILQGLHFLHAHGIIHRDVKGANVLADSSGNVKLADFGAARQLQTIRTMTGFRSMHGTPYWMAPEVVMSRPYGRRSDVWSLGCTVVEMLAANPPFYYCEPMAVLFKIGSPDEDFAKTIPEDVPEDCREFVTACFERDAELRPTSEALLSFRFVN